MIITAEQGKVHIDIETGVPINYMTKWKDIAYIHKVRVGVIREKAIWELFTENPNGIGGEIVSKRFSKHLQHLRELHWIQDKLLGHMTAPYRSAMARELLSFNKLY